MTNKTTNILAALDRLSEHAMTLRPYAHDTGAFRVGNKGATELAAACTSALTVSRAHAEGAVSKLIETLREIAAMEEREGDSLGTARSVARAAIAHITGD